MKQDSFLVKIWKVLWPLVIYVIAQYATSLIGMLILGVVSASKIDESGENVTAAGVAAGMESMYYQYAILFLIVAALISIPIYYHIYKKDCQKTGMIKRNIPIESKDFAAIILSSAALAIAMNNMISLTPLPYIFTGYEDTNEVLAGGGMILEVLGAGILGCIVEELSLRGVTYLRMKHYWGKKKAIFFSALVFGIYHGNVVQAVYAFTLGLLFAWLYERYDSLLAPIIAHMSANLLVIFFYSSEVTGHLMNTLAGYCLITCIALLIFYYGWKYMKNTNPLVELEFVEKEPDTLKRLTEEYQEQERED